MECQSDRAIIRYPDSCRRDAFLLLSVSFVVQIERENFSPARSDRQDPFNPFSVFELIQQF